LFESTDVTDGGLVSLFLRVGFWAEAPPYRSGMRKIGRLLT